MMMRKEDIAMRIKEVSVQKYLFFFIMLFLILPLVQGTTDLFWEPTLKGDVNVAPAPDFTSESWFLGDYQAVEEKHKNEAFGFRSLCIRLSNQVDFSFYGKIHASDVVMGKDNYLYEQAYIRAYYGEDFIGEDSVRHRMERLQFVKDTLAKLNKTVIMVVAAGKGFYYPEFIPDRFVTQKKRTNVEAHVEYANKFNIPYIDFNQYFVEQKPKYGHLLYPQHGTHWSIMGSDIAADSIIRYIEKARSIDMPNIYWKESETRYASEEDTDYDIGNGMNLLFNFPSKKMAYPDIHFESDAGKTKPSVLVVSDSFFWTMYNMGITNVFFNSHFWFYNREIHPGSGSMDFVNLKEELDRHDVIILMATPTTMKGYGWGFIEEAYNIYANGGIDYTKFKKRVDECRVVITSDEGQRNKAQEKAEEQKISLDSSITLEAIHQVKTAMKNEKNKIQ